MRSLIRLEVVHGSLAASLVTALVCYPRLLLWGDRPRALWFLWVLLGLVAFVMWAFVFAWYPEYRGRPVLRLRLSRREWTEAIGAGLAGAVLLGVWVDPDLRVVTPGDYPATLEGWVAGVLFSMAFAQLFLCFAPVSLGLRLFRRPVMAGGLTIAFGVLVLALQLDGLAQPPPSLVIARLVWVRALFAAVAVCLFLRGGLVPVWVWSVWVDSRLLLGFGGG